MHDSDIDISMIKIGSRDRYPLHSCNRAIKDLEIRGAAAGTSARALVGPCCYYNKAVASRASSMRAALGARTKAVEPKARPGQRVLDRIGGRYAGRTLDMRRYP